MSNGRFRKGTATAGRLASVEPSSDFTELDEDGHSIYMLSEATRAPAPYQEIKLPRLEGRRKFYFYYVIASVFGIILSALFRSMVVFLPRAWGVDILMIVLAASAFVGIYVAAFEGFTRSLRGGKEEK